MSTPSQNTVGIYYPYVASTDNPVNDMLVNSLVYGVAWSDGGDIGVSLTYSFISSESWFINTYPPPVFFLPFTNTMKESATLALSSWSNYANVSFTLVSDNSSIVGDIRFGQRDQFGSQAYAYPPSPNYSSAGLFRVGERSLTY